MPRRQQRPGWLWSGPTGSKGQIGGEVAAGAGPDTPVSSANRPPGSIWTPRASSHLVLSGLFATQLAGIFAARIPRHGFAIGLALITAGLLFGLQFCIAWRGAAGWPQRRRLGALLAMGALTYLPLVALRVAWPGMAGFFAGSILMLIRPARTSWILFAFVMASMLVAPLRLGMDARDATYLMIASLSSGLTVFAVYQLRLVSKRAQGEGTQLARLTSERERERFSMDLHDILGYSLSAITLKAELTRKLVGSDPALAQDELAEVVELARQAALDVRLMASGYSSISLVREAGSAASLLSAACITPQVAIDCGALDHEVDAVLAIVLREAVTNVLRHSAARNCAIAANQEGKMITLTVINDGVPQPVKSGTGGHGLRNLARRLEAIGGELTTGGSNDDQFSLSATVPAQGSTGLHGRPDEPRLSGPHPP
jgi:two-component system, NarL family, sensor histidine kinase DesK